MADEIGGQPQKDSHRIPNLRLEGQLGSKSKTVITTEKRAKRIIYYRNFSSRTVKQNLAGTPNFYFVCTSHI